MAHFWLKYINNAAPSSPQYMRFDGVRSMEEIDATRVATQGRRGYKYAHTLYIHRSFDLTISADELHSQTKFEWLQEFWKAHRWFYADAPDIAQPLDSAFVECVIPSGRMPVEYIGNHKLLRQVSFTMDAVVPTI